MHRLSQCPRSKGAQRSPFHGEPGQRGEHLRSLPCRRELHEGIFHSHGSVRKVQHSVHHEALTVRGDLSAPTCTTCHGNHGAAPPGVDRVENVCSNCHTFQAQMYERSSHKKAFEAASLPGCVVCHSNHGIVHPTDAKLGAGPEGVCMRCHTPGDSCDQARIALLSV